MGKYKSIAVIYGSDTLEWEISCRSGQYVASGIDKEAYDVYEVFARFGKWSLVSSCVSGGERVEFPEDARPEIDKNDFSVAVDGGKIKFDYAFIVQHGAPGETGQLQGYLEMLRVPYSTCSAFVSAVAFDKYACKRFIEGGNHVGLAGDALVVRGMDVERTSEDLVKKLGLPLFVKPSAGGSSFGITKVKTASQMPDALRLALKEGETAIVEQALTGREFTCAVYFDGSGPCALPVGEIISENEYFDYDAKYNGLSREECPADAPVEMTEHIQSVSERIYTRLGCRGLVRFDYIYAEDGLYFLETNTIPGMTAVSLVPKMLAAAGISPKDFFTVIIENS